MKPLILLSLKCFKAFLKNSLITLLIIGGGSAISFFCLFLFTGLSYRDYKAEVTDNIPNPANRITIEIDNIPQKEIRQLLTQSKAENMPILNFIKTSTDKDNYSVIGLEVVHGNYPATINGGRFFNHDEQSMAERVVIVSDSYRSSLSKDEFIQLPDSLIKVGDIEYKAIGAATYFLNEGDIEFALPLKTYIKDEFNVSYLTLSYTDRLTNAQQEQIKSLLLGFDGITDIEMPKQYYAQQISQLIRSSGVNFLIVLLSFFCTLNLTSYWIKKNVLRFRAYVLSGANNKDIAIIAVLNMLYICALSYIVSKVSYMLISPIFINNGLVAKVDIIIESSLILLLIIVILAFTIFTSLRVMKKTSYKG